MNDKEKVLKAIINAFTKNIDVLDIMGEVNHQTLGMTEIQFSEAMFMLQKDKIISGVMFENGDPNKISLWDDINVNTSNLRTFTKS